MRKLADGVFMFRTFLSLAVSAFSGSLCEDLLMNVIAMRYRFVSGTRYTLCTFWPVHYATTPAVLQ